MNITSLTQPSMARPRYYLVSMLANDSEENRVVLMNGHVISSRLREIKEENQEAME